LTSPLKGKPKKMNQEEKIYKGKGTFKGEKRLKKG